MHRSAVHPQIAAAHLPPRAVGFQDSGSWDANLQKLFDDQGGVATSGQIYPQSSRDITSKAVLTHFLERIWQGVYCLGEPSDELRTTRSRFVVRCHRVPVMSRNRRLYSVSRPRIPRTSTRSTRRGHQLRPVDGLVVHRRDGAPPGHGPANAPPHRRRGRRSRGRPAGRADRAPWRRIDAALRSGTCGRGELSYVAKRHAWPPRDCRRPGFYCFSCRSPRAESPMESEARLAMIDGRTASLELQYEVVDDNGESTAALDFALARAASRRRVPDGLDWHGDAEGQLRPRPPSSGRATGHLLDGLPDRVRRCATPCMGVCPPASTDTYASRSRGLSPCALNALFSRGCRSAKHRTLAVDR